MKHFTLLLVGVICCISLTKAQNNYDTTTIISLFQSSAIDTGEVNDLYFLGHQNPRENELDTDYLNENWEMAELITEENKKYFIKARYRIKDSRIEFQFNGTTFDLYPHIIRAIRLQNKIIVPYLINLENVKEYAFLELLVDGKIQLLQQISRKNAELSYQFFYSKKTSQNEDAFAIKGKKKSILDVLKNKRTLIDSYVKKNGLGYCDKGDLMKIFSFYNQK